MKSPVKLFYGNDIWTMDQQIHQLVDEVLSDESTRPFNLEQLDGDTASLEGVLLSANSLPFMADKRVIVVHEPAFLASGAKKKGLVSAEEEKALLAYCENPNPSTLLIFRMAADDALAGLGKKILPLVDGIACQKPKGSALAPWLRQQAKEAGRGFTPEAMAILIETGNQLSTLAMAQELEKLFLYIDDDMALIDADTVQAIITPTSSVTIFKLIDAMLAGHVPKAIAAYKDCLYLGEVPQRVLYRIIETIRHLLMVQSMLSEGMTQGAIQKALHCHEYYAKKTIGQARQLSTDTLSHLYTYLVDCDVQSKSTSGLDMTAFVEEVLINCSIGLNIRGKR